MQAQARVYDLSRCLQRWRDLAVRRRQERETGPTHYMTRQRRRCMAHWRRLLLVALPLNRRKLAGAASLYAARLVRSAWDVWRHMKKKRDRLNRKFAKMVAFRLKKAIDAWRAHTAYAMHRHTLISLGAQHFLRHMLMGLRARLMTTRLAKVRTDVATVFCHSHQKRRAVVAWLNVIMERRAGRRLCREHTATALRHLVRRAVLALLGCAQQRKRARALTQQAVIRHLQQACMGYFAHWRGFTARAAALKMLQHDIAQRLLLPPAMHQWRYAWEQVRSIGSSMCRSPYV